MQLSLPIFVTGLYCWPVFYLTLPVTGKPEPLPGAPDTEGPSLISNHTLLNPYHITITYPFGAYLFGGNIWLQTM